jgi:3-oxoacyl-[acyl-carrier protein] reductase
MNLSSARVLVTGGSSGIGRATAKLLAERGARVAICGRDERRLREAADEIGAVAIPGDVSKEGDAVRIVQTAIRELGGYDTLVNNAGIGGGAPLVDIQVDHFRRVWEVNVLGAMLVARESARHFVSQRRGNIVNVASTSSQRAGPGGSAYASTKFALAALTQSWRAELRKHDVRVMQINPSEVVTEFFERSGRTQKDDPAKLHPEEIAHVIASMLELPDRGMVVDATVWATNPPA